MQVKRKKELNFDRQIYGIDNQYTLGLHIQLYLGEV